MDTKTFKKLQIGDEVTLAKDGLNYYSPSQMCETPRQIRAGSCGIVTKIQLPAVFGANKKFVCVDFPSLKSEYKTMSGEIRTIVPRVGAFAEDLV